MLSEKQLPSSPCNDYLELAACWGRAEERGHSSFSEPSVICPGALRSEQFYCHDPALPEKAGVGTAVVLKGPGCSILWSQPLLDVQGHQQKEIRFLTLPLGPGGPGGPGTPGGP